VNASWNAWFYWFFCILGCGLMVLGGYFYFAPPPRGNLEAAEADLEITDGVPGQKRAVLFRLNNRSSAPIRIFNLAGC